MCVQVKTMNSWYRQIKNKPTGSAGGSLTSLEFKIEDVMKRDKSVEPEMTGSSIKGSCKLFLNLTFKCICYLSHFAFRNKYTNIYSGCQRAISRAG